MSTMLKRPVLLLTALSMLLGSSATIADKPPVFVANKEHYAIRGYDTVAYHLEGKPIRGKNAYTANWNGATWRFVSAENRDQFVENPERWAPRYGGYCAWAVSNNYTAKTDPDAWSIVAGRLYLNYNKSVQAKWSNDIPGNIASGDANWPGVLSK